MKRLYYAVRYGVWSAGWDRDWGTKPDEPRFCIQSPYYDGHHFYVRLSKLWFGVTY